MDGYWMDKWPASPYYATSCTVFALGTAPGRTMDWLLDTQHDDGSWELWCGTLEETSYALQMLTHMAGRSHPAVRRGLRFIDEAQLAGPDETVRMPLWHSKELYSPLRVVDGLTASFGQEEQVSHATV